MKRLTQTIDHDPDNGMYGDCFRTAIACLLNFDHPSKVPHFMAGGEAGKEMWRRLDEFLMAHDLAVFNIGYDADPQDVMDTMSVTNPDMRYLICGKSPRGTDHQCIALDDKIEHDPSPHGGGLVGRCEDGRTWVTLFVDRGVHIA